jgi:hypothetical protein
MGADVPAVEFEPIRRRDAEGFHAARLQSAQHRLNRLRARRLVDQEPLKKREHDQNDNVPVNDPTPDPANLRPEGLSFRDRHGEPQQQVRSSLPD